MTAINADGSVDGELYIHMGEREPVSTITDLSLALDGYLREGRKSWPRFGSLWLRLIAVFVRVEFSELQTDLPRFRGREQVSVRMNRRVTGHHDAWPVLLGVVDNVMAFGEHSLTAILVRLSFTVDDKPTVY